MDAERRTMDAPIIAITGNYGEKGCELAEGYWRSVLCAGGVPLVVPPIKDEQAARKLLQRVDGLLLSGGGDLNPLLVGEEPVPQLGGVCPQRDEAELMLIRLACEEQVPMLGICRGIQMLAAALGGKLYQDLGSQYTEAPLVKHDQAMPRSYASHSVGVEADSLLSRIMQSERLQVNSFHHQAVREAGPHLRVAARATDGVIEAVESSEGKSIVGVQWHPECFILQQDERMMPLFGWLVSEAKSYRRARCLHHHMLTLDSHCDTPMFFSEDSQENASLLRGGSGRVLVDLPKMTAGGLDASIMVAYLPQKERDAESLRAATQKADHILSQIEEAVAANSESVGLARTPAELYQLKAEGRRAIMRGIENGYAIGKDLGRVEHFARRGVVYMTLCHNGDNDICDSARGNNEHGGLSPFGRQVVAEMNRVGMMVDLSHASERSFYDALEVSRQPIVCSHSSSRSLCNHPRNLTDEQMRSLAKAGGVAQVTLYAGFLREDSKATIDDALRHLNHMVDVMGIEHVGVGTDFDGDGGVPGMADASEIINFTRRLTAEGYSDEDIRRIWGGNFLRLMQQVQQAGQ